MILFPIQKKATLHRTLRKILMKFYRMISFTMYLPKSFKYSTKLSFRERATEKNLDNDQDRQFAEIQS